MIIKKAAGPPPYWEKIKQGLQTVGLRGDILSILGNVNSIVWEATPPAGSANAIASVSNQDENNDGILDKITFYLSAFPVNATDEEIDGLVAQVARTLVHEKAHIDDYDPDSKTFPGGEGVAESAERGFSLPTNFTNLRKDNIARRLTVNNELISLANHLDASGHVDLADRIDNIVRSASPSNPTATELERIELWKDRLSTLEVKVETKNRGRWYPGKRRDQEQVENLRGLIDPYDRAIAMRSGLFGGSLEERAERLTSLRELRDTPLPDTSELRAPVQRPSQPFEYWTDRGPIDPGLRGEAVSAPSVDKFFADRRNALEYKEWADLDHLCDHGPMGKADKCWQYKIKWPSPEDAQAAGSQEEAEKLIKFQVITIPSTQYLSAINFRIRHGPKYQESWDRLKTLAESKGKWRDDLYSASPAPAALPAASTGLVAQQPQGPDETRFTVDVPTGQSGTGTWSKVVYGDGTVEYFDPSGTKVNQSTVLHFSAGNQNINDANVSWTEVSPADDGHLKGAAFNDLANDFTFGIRHPSFRR